MFATTLFAHLSISQVQRQKFIATSLAQGIIFIGLFLILARTNDYPSLLGINFLAFAVIIPQLISRLVIRQRMKEPIIQLKINIITLISGIVGIAFMLLLTLLMLIPNYRSIADGKPIYDTEYFVSRISFLLATIPAIILYFIIAKQRTTIYPNGLFHNGLFFAWSDFQVYSWRNHKKKKDVQEIKLTTAQNVWTPSQIKFTIPNESKEKIESFLAQRLNKSSESA